MGRGAMGRAVRAIGRDVSPELERWTQDRWQQLVRVRYVGVPVLALAASLLFQWWIGPPVLVLGLAANAANHRVVTARGRPASWLPVSDMLLCLAVAGFEPRATLPVALVMATTIAFWAAAGSTRPAAVATAIATVGLLVLDLADVIPGTGVPAVSFGLSAGLILVGVGSLVDGEEQLRARLTGLIDDLDAVLWTKDPTTHAITYVNGRAAALLGLAAEEWRADGFWLDHIHRDDRVRVLEDTAEAIDARRDHEITYRMVHADGSVVHVLDRVTVVTDASGRVTELHGVTLDVTRQRSIEEQSQQYADIVEHIDLALVVIDWVEWEGSGAFVVRAANPASDGFLSGPWTRAHGRLLTDELPTLAPAVVARLRDVSRTGRPIRLDDLSVSDGDTHRSVTIQGFRLPGDLVAISLQDTTKVAQAARALRRQALHDALTGLPNRASLDEHLRASVGEGEHTALLLMDLDQFKEVNDALGHGVGDRLLVALSHRLETLLRPMFVARLGGDEFAVVMNGPEVDEMAARATAETVAVAVAAPFTIDEVRLQTNVSIGIALVPDHATDADELIRRADVAMYVAKRSGSGPSVYRADQDSSSVARLTLIGDLREAVPTGQLVLHYQPVLDLRTGAVTRTEALVRWQHPDHGLIMPDDFIPLAALSGATKPIARWVIREAARATAALRADGHDLGVAVNLSVRNLFDRDLLGELERALGDARLAPEHLVVELTESEIMDDPSVALAQFRAFQALGVGTSVDDFGTGYSSLTYIRDLPLTELKIDRSFVADMHQRGGAYTIVRSMIDLGHNLGLEVVAEGVEHPDDMPTLIRLGCDRAQGFAIARPMPEADLAEWLNDRAAGRAAMSLGAWHRVTSPPPSNTVPDGHSVPGTV
ncbi:MAG TPA: EAL domain-containing protein [Iamia sp.]|nr:EAL domain-containing protein [Iamia sp.]